MKKLEFIFEDAFSNKDKAAQRCDATKIFFSPFLKILKYRTETGETRDIHEDLEEDPSCKISGPKLIGYQIKSDTKRKITRGKGQR